MARSFLFFYGCVFLAGMGAKAEYDDEDMCSKAQADQFLDRLTNGAEWGQCLEVSVVLVNDGVLDGDVPEDDHGKWNQPCVRADHFTPPVGQASDCPRGWNCNLVTAHNPDGSVDTTQPSDLQACRNGLYCHHGNSRRTSEPGTCEQCSSCPPNGPCGNCRTTFYPRVDEYSVLRVQDYCDRTSQPETCNGWMGCYWAGSHCLPGPIPSTGAGGHLSLRAPDETLATDADKHMIFTPGQEFYVEMGRDGVGNGVVRSPIVVFAQDNVEVAAMYLKLGMVKGFPRKISWEQTHVISSSCGVPGGTPPHVKYPGSRSHLRPQMVAHCASTEGHCPPPQSPPQTWPMTDCGFSTFEGHYDTERKFSGMRWVGPAPTNATIEGGPPDDCTQDMCGTVPVKGEPVAPVQMYLTWMGTDIDDRDMTSGGLTYEAFQQYSAFEAISKAKDVASNLAKKSRECVTSKNC